MCLGVLFHQVFPLLEIADGVKQNFRGVHYRAFVIRIVPYRVGVEAVLYPSDYFLSLLARRALGFWCEIFYHRQPVFVWWQYRHITRHWSEPPLALRVVLLSRWFFHIIWSAVRSVLH